MSSPELVLPNVSKIRNTGDLYYTQSLSVENATVTQNPVVYDGESHIATGIVVFLNNRTLIEGTDYMIYNNTGGVNVGTYSYTVTGIGSYMGNKTCTYIIDKITPTIVAPTAKVLAYAGYDQALVNAGYTDYGTLQYSLDGETWSTQIPTGLNQGSYTVWYRVVGDSTIYDVDPVSVACSINEKPVTATITFDPDYNYVYDGMAKRPTVVVKDGDTVIDPSEYEVIYGNNINAGTATATIIDNVIGNYSIVGSADFAITKAPRTISGLNPSIIMYMEHPVTVTPTASVSGGTYTYESSDDSIVTFVNGVLTGVSAGIANVTVRLSEIGNYQEAVATATVAIRESWVEIGGIKWSVMNVGTNNPAEVGPYFQWADAQGYAATQVTNNEKLFSWSDYKYTDDNGSTMSKYNSTDAYTTIQDEDDATKVIWDDSWRMPTRSDFNNLITSTTTSWVTNYQGSGVSGLLFMDNIDNTKTLFFPAGGYAGDGTMVDVTSVGRYWSSTLSSTTKYAHYLDINNTTCSVAINSRYLGYSIRPIFDPQ